MSNRARGLAYAAEVKDKANERRTNRPRNFAAPAARSGPPSYAFVDNQRSTVDDTADKTLSLRKEEKDLEDDKDRDVTDKTTFVAPTKSGKAPTPTVITKSQVNEVTELKSAFRKCWTIVDQINIPLKSYDEKSFFVPNAIMLFNILFNLEEALNGNEDLRWTSPNYFSLPVRVYYAVIFFVQILRAKEQAGKIEKAEGSWLRAFFRRFKDTLCPIAGPLVPYFTNITTVLPDDNQFEFVYPTMEKKGSYSAGTENVTDRRPNVRDTHFLTPSVPIIASLLRDFCTTRTLGDDKFDDDGNYVPFSLTTGGNFAGVTFPPNAGSNLNIVQLLTNPVLMKPLPESKDRLIEIHNYWKRSGVRNIPDIPTNLSYDPETPSGWTLIESDFDWFQKCVDMATIQCKYFSENSNLSQIPTTGGNSTLVVATLKLDNRTGPPTSTDTWFMDKYSSIKAKFKSNTAELEQDDVYQAAYALTNANLTWTRNNANIGSTDTDLRRGPYFTDNKVNFELDYEVPIGSNVYSMVQSQFYDAHKIN